MPVIDFWDRDQWGRLIPGSCMRNILIPNPVFPAPGTPPNGLIAEDGVTFLVAEDGKTFLVQE